MIISYLFNLLFFALPFLFFPKTSEVFEFNKIVFLYITTILIISFWIVKMINARKVIFRRTTLDIPLIIFLASQVITTLISLDPYVSFFGFYGRWNGGLISTICYIFLYWAYVSNIDKDQNRKNIISLLISGFLISLWGILEHFGYSISCIFIWGKLTNSCWVQDVGNRVFATFGQPNWLAAWIVAISPLAWWKMKNSKNKFFLILPPLFFATLLFTKSKSGIIAFIISYLIFWAFSLSKKTRKIFLISSLVFITIAGIFGTPWTPALIRENKVTQTESSGEGGTDSGEIRKIVWKGAIDVFKNNPILGTGVETFAYSYFQYKPLEGNLTSEWDFIYNKAHNEFLNIAANSGIVGIGSYIFLIISIIILLIKQKNIAVLAAFSSLLITNFFGFSVVATSFLFFILPAIAVSEKNKPIKEKLSLNPLGIAALILGTLGIFIIGRYWYADYLYNQSKNNFENGQIKNSIDQIKEALDISPYEPTYHNQSANIFTDTAVLLKEQDFKDESDAFATAAENEIELTLTFAPKNIILRRSAIANLQRLAEVNPQYLATAEELAQKSISLSPTDPRIYFTFGKIEKKLGKIDEARKAMQKAIELKPDYKTAEEELKAL